MTSVDKQAQQAKIHLTAPQEALTKHILRQLTQAPANRIIFNTVTANIASC